MLGWRLPRRIGRPGVVTSRLSAARRPTSADPRSSDPRSASAASMAPRTTLPTAPTRGRSSGGSAPIPRRTVVRRPFLPRMSTSRASSSATSAIAAIDAEGVVAECLEVAGQVCEVHVRPSIGGPAIMSPRPSATSRARRGVSAVAVGRSGPPVRRAGRRSWRSLALGSWRARRSSRTSPRRGSARSARILRSISMSARFRPAMNWPYVRPFWRAAALIRTIHSWRNWRLRCLRSRVA